MKSNMILPMVVLVFVIADGYFVVKSVSENNYEQASFWVLMLIMNMLLFPEILSYRTKGD